MRGLARLFRQNWKMTLLFVVLGATYIVLTLNSHPTTSVLHRYHTTAAHLHTLALTVAIPYIIVWVIGLVGYLKLRSYTKLLSGGKDEPGFKTLSQGVMLLAIWLPASTVLTSIANNYYGGHASMTAILIRVINYLNVTFLLVAFYLTLRGSEKLIALTKATRWGLTQRQTMIYIALAAVYIFIAFSDPVRQVPSASVRAATYYEPDWLVLVTILIPRLIMWFMGITAAANVLLYRREVKGTIYKAALKRLAFGIAGVVLVTVMLRVLQSIASFISDWSLTGLLLFIYLLLILIAVGYGLVASGARRLQKIEES